MKILLTIQNTLNPDSGAAGSTYMLAKYYEDLGHNVSIFSLDKLPLPSYFPDPLKEILFPVFVAKYIACLSHNNLIDIVDGSTGDLWIWGLIFKKIRKNPPLLVTRIHNLEHKNHLDLLTGNSRNEVNLSWKYWIYRGSIRLWQVASSLKTSDLVFQLNQEDSSYVINHIGVDPKKSYIFPNGIPDEFIGLPFEATPLLEKEFIGIAQIGTYISRKGIIYSSPVINEILKKYPNVRVTFLGTECLECPDESQVYKDFDPDLHDRITVIPRYKHIDLITLLQGHHIKILASTYEAFGKALIEAMACGLAPITTATSGPLEVVKNNYDALVIPVRDKLAMQSALENLIIDRTKLNMIRLHAYTTAQNYSWRNIAQKRIETYEVNSNKNKFYLN